MARNSDFRALKKYCYFSTLSDGALEAVHKKLHSLEMPAGSVIIKEGEPADSFYLLSEGEVEVRKRTKWGQDAKISVISSGQGFGEMALLTCSPRCCSVIAMTDVRLMRLLRTDFDEILRVDSAISHILDRKVKDYSQYNSIKTLQPFALIEPEKMAALIETLQERRFSRGDLIISQGEAGNEFFIIKSGSVAVLKKMETDEAVHVATLSDGEAFGEEALLSNSPRNATIRAETDTVVYALPREQFDRIMKSAFLEEVDPRTVLEDSGDYGLLDVRLKYEYDEERIPGAINIPLDELRRRCDELDRGRRWYVYCLVGARSATAAFLLKSRGFDAASIRGGIMDWPGEVEEHHNGVHAPFKPT